MHYQYVPVTYIHFDLIYQNNNHLYFFFQFAPIPTAKMKGEYKLSTEEAAEEDQSIKVNISLFCIAI